jgi:arabinoxylan arabinofuranohydrolase
VEQFEYNADGTIPHIPMTKKGVSEPVAHVSPYARQEAEMIALSVGVRTAQDESRGVYLDSLDMGDYVKVKAVDFGEEGARSVRLCVRQRENDGFIQVCIDSQSNVVAPVCRIGWNWPPT